jgi:hypothetical protein
MARAADIGPRLVALPRDSGGRRDAGDTGARV